MNVPVSRAAEGFARRAFTVPDLRRMHLAGILGIDERVELIEGEIVPVSPKGNHHEVIKAALNRIFASRAPESLRVAVETTLYLSIVTMVEPDICVYPITILPEDVRGHNILLAVEVADSSLGFDRTVKARIYASHGVQELWIIDAQRRVSWVYREPKFDGSWGHTDEKPAEAKLTASPIPEIEAVIGNLR